jgi:hypothetical protein
MEFHCPKYEYSKVTCVVVKVLTRQQELNIFRHCKKQAYRSHLTSSSSVYFMNSLEKALFIRGSVKANCQNNERAYLL